MAELKGTNVAATVVPFTSDDKYATHDAEYGKGGFRSVGTIAERDSIPVDRKTEGMVVRVQADKKHYVWESNAWAEWLPKSNVTLDQALSTTSTNAVSNKAATTGINEAKTAASTAQGIANTAKSTADAAIPKANIDKTRPVTTADDKVPSTKLVFTALDTVNDIAQAAGTLAGTANNTAMAAIPKSYIDTTRPSTTTDTRVPSTKLVFTQIDSVSGVANAAIPKSYIDTTLPSSGALDTRVPSTKIVSTALDTVTTLANSADGKADAAKSAASNAQTTANNAIPKANIDTVIPASTASASDAKVPSTKAVTAVTLTLESLANAAQTAADSAQASANQAQTTANNAIPKSKIDTSIAGTETDQTTVPSVPAFISFVQAEDSKVLGRVATLESWKSSIGIKGSPNGVAGLDSSGKVPAAQLPSYVDDVVDVQNFVTTNPSAGMTVGNVYYNSTTKKLFTATSATTGVITDPESDKIYIKIIDGTLWRWSGTTMAQINGGLVLGTTSTTAGRGDWVNTLYTNFGSGTNLTGTQAARDFFSNTPPSSSLYFNGATINHEAARVMINMKRRLFNGTDTSDWGVAIMPATSTASGVMSPEMYKTLQEIELATFPLEMTLAGAGTYEVGSSIKPDVSIYITRKGVNVNSGSTITVTSSPTVAGSLNSSKDTWTANSSITATTSFTVKAVYGSQDITKTLIYYFKYKKYWGVSANASLTNAEIIALGSSTWADSRTMNATNFDCTGGKYPYYVIPASIYTGLEVWVGGLKNTDLVVSDITLTNASGSSAAYKVVRLANKQTGVLSIQFK